MKVSRHRFYFVHYHKQQKCSRKCRKSIERQKERSTYKWTREEIPNTNGPRSGLKIEEKFTNIYHTSMIRVQVDNRCINETI